ncbi:MAG: DUF2027 domain-containing protein [Bacteroidales bacterium]|nr:DUF2027 domain-containing protein [Bacteroidales bacterium]MBN2761622.1 DUF2027 domain-containing protein [Bacteroidales bacterium]
MKFNVGDIVRFLNDTGGGKVTRIEEKGYVYVMTGDGFEIPVLPGELILQSGATFTPDENIFAENDIAKADKTKVHHLQPAEIKTNVKARLPEGLPSDTQIKLLLGLVPEDINAVFNTAINCYLINDSRYYIYYMVGYQKEGKHFYLHSGEVEPDTKCFLADFNQTRLGMISAFHIQALAVCGGQYFKRTPINEEVDISRYDFRKHHIYGENEYFDEEALILGDFKTEALHQKKTIDLRSDELSEGLNSLMQKKKPDLKKPDSMEVDLHIETLLEDHSQLSNGEILKIQMNRFRSALDEAISNKAKRIVFIHGVGNGTLKLELRNELRRSYPEYTYQDASFKEYGFGATLVHLR